MGEGSSKDISSSASSSFSSAGGDLPQDYTNQQYPMMMTSPPKLIDAAIKGQVDTVAKLLKKGKKV